MRFQILVLMFLLCPSLLVSEAIRFVEEEIIEDHDRNNPIDWFSGKTVYTIITAMVGEFSAARITLICMPHETKNLNMRWNVNEKMQEQGIEELLLQKAAIYAETKKFQSISWYVLKNSIQFLWTKELVKKYPMTLTKIRKKNEFNSAEYQAFYKIL